MDYDVKVDLFKTHEKVERQIHIKVAAPDATTARIIALKMAKAAHPDLYHFAWDAEKETVNS